MMPWQPGGQPSLLAALPVRKEGGGVQVESGVGAQQAAGTSNQERFMAPDCVNTLEK